MTVVERLHSTMFNWAVVYTFRLIALFPACWFLHSTQRDTKLRAFSRSTSSDSISAFLIHADFDLNLAALVSVCTILNLRGVLLLRCPTASTALCLRIHLTLAHFAVCEWLCKSI